MVVAGFAIARRGRHVSAESSADIDTGSVSESWLAEQRGNKNDRL
jgi:hypothetical protein